jgi:hypothetical protein
MTPTIPDLWSEDITVNVLPPVAVLRALEGLLARKTQGLLQAKLTTTATDRLVQHQLDLVAPALNFYRERLLSATHDRDMVYPVLVTAACFAPRSPNPPHWLAPMTQAVTAVSEFLERPAANQREATTQEEFIDLVREVLHSAEVRSLIQSLIARSNEVRAAQEGGESTRPGSTEPERSNGNPGDGERQVSP